MGVKERRERERTETRERIMDAARELFISEGYDKVSMRRVADAIEYSPTAIYVHFRDKEDLFLQICHADFHKLAESFTSVAKIADPRERLRRIGMAYIEFGMKNPFHYRMMFMTPHPPTQLSDEEKAAQGCGNPEEDAYAFLRHTVQETMKSGVFREEYKDAELLAQTLWAGVHGVIALQIAKSTDNWVAWRSLKKRAETMIDGLMYGLFKVEK
jgi:AcrR family transcriptional regulator